MIDPTKLAKLTVLTGLLAAGCNSNPADQATTGPYTTPNISASHYNPVVNDTGARTGTDDPAIHPTGTSEVNGSGMQMAAPAGGVGGTNVGGGTSTQNGGSSSPSGATGSSGTVGR